MASFKFKGKLSGLSMYRMMVYLLSCLLALALVLALIGQLSFDARHILGTTGLIVVSCYFFNNLGGFLFKIKPNTESYLITALILSLVVGPVDPVRFWQPLMLVSFASIVSKFLLRWRGGHVFNPAAFGLVVMYMVTDLGSSWWIGMMPLTLAVIIGGMLIGTKIKRLTTSWLYVISYLALFILLNGINLSIGTNFQLLESLLLNSPLLFFAFIMLIEPATSPSNKKNRQIFAVLVALLTVLIQRYFAEIPYSFEGSLLAGNLILRAMERKDSFTLTLVEKKQLSPTIFKFIFDAVPAVKNVPGQFLEWTLPHQNADSRGIRRWFTVSSSPTESQVFLTTRFAEKSSTFKQTLKDMEAGEQIHASGLEGDFILPNDKKEKLLFIAGGIGITPFRSMVRFLLDSNESRDIVLLYASKKSEDLVFMDLFNLASQKIGLKVTPVLSNPDKSWGGKIGQIDQEFVENEVPDLLDRIIYVSGPEQMVESMTKTLRAANVKKANIREDFFPGYTAVGG